MTVNRQGCTRIVVLTKNYAFKIPNFLESFGGWKWKMFLEGQLANQYEYRLWRCTKDNRLCPVIFYIPFGLLVVMPRVRVMDTQEYTQFNIKQFTTQGKFYLGIEEKANSLGYLNNRIVAIDYAESA